MRRVSPFNSRGGLAPDTSRSFLEDVQFSKIRRLLATPRDVVTFSVTWSVPEGRFTYLAKFHINFEKITAQSQINTEIAFAREKSRFTLSKFRREQSDSIELYIAEIIFARPEPRGLVKLSICTHSLYAILSVLPALSACLIKH